MFIDVNSLPIEILYEPELNSTAFIENNNVKSAETEVNQLDSTIFEYNDPGNNLYLFIIQLCKLFLDFN